MNMLVFEVPHKIGDTVYLKSDPNQHERIVIGYYVDATSVMYRLSFIDAVSTNYDCEISIEKRII